MLKKFEGCGIEVKVIYSGEVVSLTVALATHKNGLNCQYEVNEETGEFERKCYPEIIWVDGKGSYTTGNFYSGGETGVGKDRMELKKLGDDVDIITTGINALIRYGELEEEKKRKREERAKIRRKKMEEAVQAINSMPDVFVVKTDLDVAVEVTRKEARIIDSPYGGSNNTIDCSLSPTIDGIRVWFDQYFTAKGNLRKKNVDAAFGRVLGKGEPAYQAIRNLKAKFDEVKNEIKKLYV